jgi:uncharacterized protein (UPF0276 family)
VTDLSVTYSSHLLDLAQDTACSFPYIRLGNWHEETLVAQALDAFPDRTFLYHHNGNVPHDEQERQTFIAYLQRWQRRTSCPWLSLHLDYHKEQEIRQVVRGELQPPLYDAAEAFALLCDGVRQVTAQLDVPLILENVPSWPRPVECPEATPEFCRRVLEATGCGLLLDTAHARMASGTLGYDVYAYLGAFPLERVVEVHVSSPRYVGGRWRSRHEVLEAEDYALLEWLLARTAPKAITLEYWREREQIRKQVVRLGEVIARVGA